jgi:hypothetical protein
VNEAELRALIREAVARHLRAAGAEDERPSLPPARSSPALRPASPGLHPSQVIYIKLANAADGCLIEPTVSCNHCGYCKTHGY